ncbi:uncharacterized protein LOC34617664 [Cyclospora cayetanensis]|uniref:Uncharacterized protein LOC34617664 n=1 Tax=Cyclospora cayetanensis TaxID=88456 RepID=A0A6P6S1I7_9EIME|nr:uncharacterized protein LOC34617664 [Cyclospora cayetanensis]
MQARLLDVQELKVLVHELGHAFKEMLQEDPKAFVAERLLDFDESFALVHEQLLRRPQFLMALSKHRETGAPLTFSQAAGLGLDLVDLLHPNGALVTAAVDFAIHSLDASKATTQSLEESIRAAIEESYSGALVCYILAEMRALRILQQLEKGPPSRVGPALPDLRAVKRDLLPLHPRGPLPPLMGTSGGAAAGASLVALYSAPKDLQGVECLLGEAPPSCQEAVECWSHDGMEVSHAQSVLMNLKCFQEGRGLVTQYAVSAPCRCRKANREPYGVRLSLSAKNAGVDAKSCDEWGVRNPNGHLWGSVGPP